MEVNSQIKKAFENMPPGKRETISFKKTNVFLIINNKK